MADKKYTLEEKEIISEIHKSIMELEAARNAFDFVNDSRLIDLCIHREDEARTRFSYFLEEAKNKGLRMDAKYMVEELNCYGKW